MKHKKIFKQRVSSEIPAEIAPINVSLDATKKPLRAMVSHYSVQTRDFLNEHITQLVKFLIQS